MLSSEENLIIILSCCLLGLIWSITNAIQVSKVKLVGGISQQKDSFNQQQDDQIVDRNIYRILEVASHIEQGSNTFLTQQYKYMSVFVLLMAFLIFFVVEDKLGNLWTTIAFIIGCITSILSGYIGMRVAVFSNYRTAYQAANKMSLAFSVAYRAGCVMGFTLTSLGLLVLSILIAIYTNMYIDEDYHDYTRMYECIAGYGLGASTIALFGRVGGGIFTKAADVGADLVGKIEKDLPEDSPNNPATIADNVGDNVGDIAGMGSDLFGSFAEATSAALVIASESPAFYYQPQALYYPLLISAFGIVVCLITSLLAHSNNNESMQKISTTLFLQLLISTILATPALYLASFISLPDRLYGFLDGIERNYLHAFYCTIAGLWAGLFVGLITGYYTSYQYQPVREVARSCETGAATNVIYGIALGHWSTFLPVLLLSGTAFLCHSLLGMFGLSLGALGMLSTMSIGLAIDAYGPVSDNAGGIAEMCNMGENVRVRTDALDAAGNTTAAIGKGFAICSAALVSLALYGAFIKRAQNPENYHPLNQGVDITNPLTFSAIIIGAMLPYAFSALTIKSVGKAASQMVQEIRNQLEANPLIITGQVAPDYKNCVKIATDSSLYQMFAPAAIVIGAPFFAGLLFGPNAVAGILPGMLVSGVSMAISSANSGGAWDNAKKYIESGQYINQQGEVRNKGSLEHKAAIVGDTVGDPLKDTSGPSLNILIKLSAIFSLIFIRFFDSTAFLQCTFAPNSSGCKQLA